MVVMVSKHELKVTAGAGLIVMPIGFGTGRIAWRAGDIGISLCSLRYLRSEVYKCKRAVWARTGTNEDPLIDRRWTAIHGRGNKWNRNTSAYRIIRCGNADIYWQIGINRHGNRVADAGLPDVHCAEEFKVQVMISPLEGVYEKTGLFVPALPPFSFHCRMVLFLRLPE